MLRRNVLIVILLLLPIICCHRAQRDRPKAVSEQPREAIAIERWPQEGTPVIAWTGSGDSMAVFSQPGEQEPADYLPVKGNQQLRWDKSLILVHKLGKLMILEACTISGHVYDALRDNKLLGGKTREYTFRPGTVLDVVCYASEGDYIFHYQGKYVQMSGSHDCQQIMTIPQMDWWVRLEDINGHSWWVQVDDKTVSVIDRRF
jgi:hypothetical protein